MLTLLAPVLAIAGFVGYVVITTWLGVYRREPWEYLAVSAAGVALGLWRFARRPRATTALAALVAVGALGGASWFLFSYSMFPAREERPQVGERFPDFRLPTSTRDTFALGDARGRRLLVLAYRGDW